MSFSTAILRLTVIRDLHLVFSQFQSYRLQPVRGLFQTAYKFLVMITGGELAMDWVRKHLTEGPLVSEKHIGAIFIQSTTACNANCINCPHPFTYGSRGTHSKGAMTDKIWNKIIQDILTMGYRNQVGLYLHHEPLLERTLFKKIRQINEATEAFAVISTNGSLLNKKNRRSLIDARPRIVHININSADKGQYEKMTGLNFETTINQVKRFILEAEGKIHIEINCPVLPGVESGKLIEMFPGLQVNTDYWANSRGGLLEGISSKDKGSRFKISDYCLQPEQNFNILFDGSIIICCNDWLHESKKDFPNIMNQSILEIYNGELLKRIIAEFRNGNYERYRMCGHCSKEMGFANNYIADDIYGKRIQHAKNSSTENASGAIGPSLPNSLGISAMKKNCDTNEKQCTDILSKGTVSTLQFSNKSLRIEEKAHFNVLLTNHHLTDFTGSEVFTFTIAEFLKREGHRVTVFSKYVDENMSKSFDRIDVPIARDIATLNRESFDVAHIHHNVMAMEVRRHFTDLPFVFLSHGVLPFLEQPLPLEIGINSYLAVSEEVQENFLRQGVRESRLSIFRNIVDSDKFSPRSAVSCRPARALILSNKLDLETEKMIRCACERLCISTTFAGMRFGIVHQDYLPDLINQADIVFSLGRGVIESMMSGRVPIVLDYGGGEGMVTPDNIEQLMTKNFSGRLLKRKFNTEELVKEIDRYEPNYGESLREKALTLFGANKNIRKLVDVYREAVKHSVPAMERRDKDLIDAFLAAIDTTRHFSNVEASRRHSPSSDENRERRCAQKIDLLLASRLKKLGPKLKTLDHSTQTMPGSGKDCDILIPIFNAYGHLSRCVNSVIRHSKGDHQIYLLDDFSTDPRVLPLLKSFEEKDLRIRVIESNENRGFVYNVNRGFKLSSNDVVILNSDTEVTEGWLERMIRCFHSNPDIGIVCPLSNNATILSVPCMNQSNLLPVGIDPNHFSSLVANASEREYPEIPTGVGFCMFISRDTLNKVGTFDPAFGLGYGEENDFCMRARSAGKKVVCCDDAYVHHYGEASFGSVDKIDEKRLKNELLLDRKWPDYKRQIYNFCCHNPLRAIQERILLEIRMLKTKHELSLLHVIHSFDAPGGTELHTRSIIDGLPSHFHSTILFPAPVREGWVDLISREESDHLRVVKIRKENIFVNDYFNGQAADLTNTYVETVFSRFLCGGNYSVVHFQHLCEWDSLLLPIIAKSHGKKVIISLHDYFLLCPEYNLVLPNLKRCKKDRANGEDLECLYCLGTKRRYNGGSIPLPLKEYLEERNFVVNRIVEASDMLIAPSEFVKEAFTKAFGDAVKNKLLTVPHGIENLPKSQRPKQRSHLQVGFLGNASDKKGVFTLLHSADLLKGKPVRFQIFGSVPSSLKSVLSELGILQHGSYQRRDLPRLLAETDLVIIPSVIDETFCLTASESLKMGIPVMASNCGAICERVIEGETGFLVPPGDSKAVAEKLLKIIENPYLLQHVESNLRKYQIKELRQNIEEYTEIYKYLMTSGPKKFLNIHSAFCKAESIEYEFSIVILTFNQLDYTKKCVESIRKHTPQSHEIVFVDNGSKDGTVKWLRALVKNNPNYKIIENGRNLGFATGCNQGIRAASGDCIVLLNNDVVVTEGWLSGMMECLESAPDIGIIGPMTNNISGPQKVPDVGYSSIDDLENYALGFRKKNRYRKIPYRRVVGFCMLFKRRLVEDIGLLDESFGTGNFEDDDFCLRAALAGYRNLIAGDVFLHHYGSRSFIGNKIDYGSSISGNRKIFSLKWSRIDPNGQFGKKPIVLNAIEHAELFNRTGQPNSAISTLIEAIRKAPEEKELSLQLAEILIEAKRFKHANDILDALPSGEDSNKFALIGLCAYGLEQFDKADKNAGLALSHEPSNVQALNLKGTLAYRKADKEAAERFFKTAIDIDPSFGDSYTNLGVMKWDAGEHAEAIDLLEHGFILSPTAPDVVAAYHTAIVETEAFGRAEPIFREAATLFPDDKRISYLLIALLFQQEKYAQAMLETERAMDSFGMDEGMLSAAMNIRERIGPVEVRNNSGSGSTLSLCMIAKNEEEHIARCLLSVKPLVDEIIVVDTGSTDRTKEIAKILGAKVFEFPWTNDFSEARNYSISKSDGNYILILDADESISEIDHAALRKLLTKQRAKRTAYRLMTRNYTNEAGTKGWVENDEKYSDQKAGTGWFPSAKVRIFKNDPGIKFVNPVHEIVEPSMRQVGFKIMDCDVPIHHYGKLSKTKVIEKGRQYYRLGLQKIEEMQGDYNALRELAVQASEIGEYDDAINIWQKAINLRPKDANACMNAGYAYLKLKQYDNAMEYSRKAMELDLESREATLNYSAAELIAGDARNSVSLLENLLKIHPDYPPAMGWLAAGCIVDGRKNEGFEYLDRLEEKGFDCAGTIEEQAQDFIGIGKTEQAAVLLEAAQEKGLSNGNIQQLLIECQKKMARKPKIDEKCNSSYIRPFNSAGAKTLHPTV